MGVDSHSYGGLGGVWMEMVVDRFVEQSQEGLVACWGDVGSLPECQEMTLMTPNHTRRLRFDVNTASWLHSVVLYGHTVVVIYPD